MPGNVGVFHYLTVLVLSAFSVDRQVAVGYALVLYFVALVPKIILGAYILGAPSQGALYRLTLRNSWSART